MVIYLDEYRTARSEPAQWLKNGTYGDEVMHAEWNPAVIQVLNEPALLALSPKLPDQMSEIEAETFLGRVYGLASLI